MTKKYKILAKYIKDLSSETPDIETYLFVKDHIGQYQLGIDITSKALKDKVIEINTTLKFEDKKNSKKKSYFEIVFATIIKMDEDTKEKKELEQKGDKKGEEEEEMPNLEDPEVQAATAKIQAGYKGMQTRKELKEKKELEEKDTNEEEEEMPI